MTSWILPGRVNNPVMRYKAILETSLAFSRTFNSRNIEFPWYALWNQTLCDLVADVPNLIVTPQFPVWFVPIVDGHEGPTEGDDPEEVPVSLLSAKQVASKKPDDNEDEGGAGDISFASTVAEKHADSVVVDFVILNLTAQPQSGWKSRYGGWRIAAASVDLLVEVKRFASRSATGKAQEALIFEKIVEARGDLLNQAAHLFIQDSKKKSVLGIAAAGPYWCSTTIHRGNVTERMRDIETKDPSYRAPRERRAIPQVKWNEVIHVNLARSRERLHTIYNRLLNMGPGALDRLVPVGV